MEKRIFPKVLLVFGTFLALTIDGSSINFVAESFPNREIEIVVPYSSGEMLILQCES